MFSQPADKEKAHLLERVKHPHGWAFDLDEASKDEYGGVILSRQECLALAQLLRLLPKVLSPKSMPGNGGQTSSRRSI